MLEVLRRGSIKPGFEAPIFMSIRAVIVLDGDWWGHGVMLDAVGGHIGRVDVIYVAVTFSGR